jgi:hypothetical protein
MGDATMATKTKKLTKPAAPKAAKKRADAKPAAGGKKLSQMAAAERVLAEAREPMISERQLHRHRTRAGFRIGETTARSCGSTGV